MPREAQVVIIPAGSSSRARKPPAAKPPAPRPPKRLRPPPLPVRDEPIGQPAPEPVVAEPNGSSPWIAEPSPRAAAPVERAISRGEAPLRGYQPDARRRYSSYLASVALVVIALVGLAPSLWAIYAHFTADHSPALPKWVFVVVLVSGIQIAYAYFLGSVPDWSTAWMATGAALAGTATYSLVLSLSLMGTGVTHLVQLLELGDEVRSSGAARWCGFMLLASLAVTYFSGSFALRWHRAYRMLAELV